MGWKFAKRKIHFVGIGGAGMGSMAELLEADGNIISGSDQKESPLTDYLQNKGIKVHIGHDPENVIGCDLIVYSSAVKMDNPEMKKAFELNIPYIRRAELLGQLMNRKYGIAVAGTHGKTTVSAMISQLLIDAGFDPMVMVGGKVNQLKSGAYSGKGQWFVTEADEYDRSFLTLNPVISVVTSLEADHLDIYKDIEDIKMTFLRFINQTAFDGLFVCYGDQDVLRDLAKKSIAKVIRYGFEEHNDVCAKVIKTIETSNYFSVTYKNKNLGEFKLLLPGKHNLLNALAALSVAIKLEIPLEKIREALSAFKGVERRFEIVATLNDITFIDDYAHHPTEVKATLEAARQLNPKRLLAVFQPHLFSRTRDFFKQFAESLALADVVILVPIYPAREKPMEGVSSKLIFDVLKNENKILIETNEEIIQTLKNFIMPGDLVVGMGAGNVRDYIIKTAQKFSDN